MTLSQKREQVKQLFNRHRCVSEHVRSLLVHVPSSNFILMCSQWHLHTSSPISFWIWQGVHNTPGKCQCSECPIHRSCSTNPITSSMTLWMVLKTASTSKCACFFWKIFIWKWHMDYKLKTDWDIVRAPVRSFNNRRGYALNLQAIVFIFR